MLAQKDITNMEAYEDLKKSSDKFLLGRAKPFVSALWKHFETWPLPGRGIHNNDIYDEYEKLCDHTASSSRSVDDFFRPALTGGLKTFLGKEETDRIIEECRFITQFPYSFSTYRPSYRSSRTGDYAGLFFRAMLNSLYYTCCGKPSPLSRSTVRIALDLRRGDAVTYAAVEEAVLGESTTEEKFSRDVISAIVMSGDKKSLELLGSLLLAAKGQEGLRQAILETCDCGVLDSHKYFIKLILENDLCRFSSVIRAFDTWCGLAFGDQKQKTVEKMMSFALALLDDENAAHEALNSADTTEIYMGLWAISVRDLHAATDDAVKLLGAPEKYRRLVGWYFITNTNNDVFRQDLAAQFLDVRDPEELAWVVRNVKNNYELNAYSWKGNLSDEERERESATKKYPANYYPADAKARAALFEKALSAAIFIGKKKTKFSPSVFPWYEVQLSSESLFGLMISLAGYDRDKTFVLKITEHLDICDSNNRLRYYAKLLNPNVSRERGVLLEGLSDKSPTVKEQILKRLQFYKLEQKEIDYLQKLLSATQNAKLRMSCVTLLEKAGISADADYMLTSGTSERTLENGFGLFDPQSEIFRADYHATNRPTVELYKDAELKARIVPKDDEIIALYSRMLGVWKNNKDYEYEMRSYSGGRETVLLGSRLTTLASYDRENHKGIYDFPLTEEWLAAAGDFANRPEKLAAAMSIWHNSKQKYQSWFSDLFRGFPIERSSNSVADKIADAFRAEEWWVNRLDEVLRAILYNNGKTLFDFALTTYINLVNKIPINRLRDLCREKGERYSDSEQYVLEVEYLQYWRNVAYVNIVTDEQFGKFFNEMWYEFLASGERRYYKLGVNDVYRAHSLGLIPDEAVYRYLLLYPRSERYNSHPFHTLTNKRLAKDILDKYPAAKGLLDKAIDAVVSVESVRGELETPLTNTVPHIDRFSGGVTHFVTMLAALGNDGFSRNRYFSYRKDGVTKKDSLSHLLRGCLPLESDTAESLRAALKEAKISEKRALQAALFAPLWAELMEDALEIPGLKCGVWFFHAHINEGFSAEKETEVALFSAITPLQFKDGAFDKDWFFEAYHTLGEKRFIELYKNAKLITDSNIAHRRSQLYTDAVLGRMDKAVTLREIKEKRNQERIRAYALIPLDSKNKNDALERYEFINQFKKESRQFGSLRQASEGKAVTVALDNLAITTDYGDADRMTWALEGKKIETLRPLMEPHTIGEVTVKLVIESDGTPNVEAEKKGKLLKTLPKELNKDEYVADMKSAAKSLKDQKSRAKLKFEMAMVSRTEFRADEIAALLQNPVLCGMVKDLVFVSGNTIGFPTLENDKLVLKDHNCQLTIANRPLIIAHPYDFMRQKCWSDYQRYLFENRIQQPFKQIFREYYPITDDEKQAANVSTRYEGYQVQPKKTVALLKTRGWTVDYEDGLQRVWHKENLVVRMYAMADWFSPSDIEAPTLETIQFYRRDKWERVPFDEVPPVLFSETMRDIDLVVSVAYVGGVDPEASHSTVEMRVAIARELLSLLTVKNVSFKTAHAIVQGNMGEYSVHMGSGIVHKLGAGMIAVLPVHSQHRGRIFLPFADDDPKTAEIMSKILLFAEDSKIKDPGILSQI